MVNTPHVYHGPVKKKKMTITTTRTTSFTTTATTTTTTTINTPWISNDIVTLITIMNPNDTYLLDNNNDNSNNINDNGDGDGAGNSPGPLITLFVPLLMFCAGVLGNVMALVLLWRSRRDNSRSVFYRLVAGLALTDLLGIMATSPVTILVYSKDRQWVGGQPVCNYFSFMMIFAGLATVLVVGCMAVERFLAILHPYTYERCVSPKRANCVLVGVWVASVLISCLPLVKVGQNVKHWPGTWCFFDYYSERPADNVFAIFFAVIGLLVIAATAVCNFAVMVVLLRMRRVSQNIGKSHEGRTLNMTSEMQMIFFLAGILLVFAACYSPLMVRIIMNVARTTEVDQGADLQAIRLASVNQILDPWVYLLFRRRLARLLYSMCKSVSPIHTLSSLKALRAPDLADSVTRKDTLGGVVLASAVAVVSVSAKTSGAALASASAVDSARASGSASVSTKTSGLASTSTSTSALAKTSASVSASTSNPVSAMTSASAKISASASDPVSAMTSASANISASASDPVSAMTSASAKISASASDPVLAPAVATALVSGSGVHLAGFGADFESSSSHKVYLAAAKRTMPLCLFSLEKTSVGSEACHLGGDGASPSEAYKEEHELLGKTHMVANSLLKPTDSPSAKHLQNEMRPEEVYSNDTNPALYPGASSSTGRCGNESTRTQMENSLYTSPLLPTRSDYCDGHPSVEQCDDSNCINEENCSRYAMISHAGVVKDKPLALVEISTASNRRNNITSNHKPFVLVDLCGTNPTFTNNRIGTNRSVVTPESEGTTAVHNQKAVRVAGVRVDGLSGDYHHHTSGSQDRGPHSGLDHTGVGLTTSASWPVICRHGNQTVVKMAAERVEDCLPLLMSRRRSEEVALCSRCHRDSRHLFSYV